MKKVLVVTHYFWPENFKINSICHELIKRGYDVSVLTGKPNYPVGSFYRGYNFFNKNIIRLIMYITKGPTNISMAYEFTDWHKVLLFSKKILSS